ncbi:hypothetical protein KDA_44140 [Dictyobacter alpinus]|uniref:Intracellular proteinase inhibitor BsuPI domain-containing protein n=1 Tax=Dictyobacter alpinus TaxID=2014873 RepID=A0A402BCA2_9CHLR|nr:hypothetical protein [Dictyobacter alpinus]GCE28930.1 hypothetical protein KDA_44140 [Dictyobacter alpinus]
MRSNKFSITLFIAVPLCLILLAACGNQDAQSNSNSSASNPTPKPTPTPTTQQSTPTPTPTPQSLTPTPTNKHQMRPPSRGVPIPGSPQDPKSGIKLALDKAGYSTKDPINVTISNNMKDTIYLSATGTSCSMIQLEMLVNGNWQPQGRCINVHAAPLVPLNTGKSINQKLQPQTGPMPTKRTDTSVWQPGTYRATLNFSGTVDPDTVGGKNIVVSATFTIS